MNIDQLRRYQTRKYPMSLQFAICIAMVLLTSLLCFTADQLISYRLVSMILLISVSLLAMLFETFPVLIAAILSALIWNFFFIPPIMTFHIEHAEDLVMFILYFIIASVNAVLTYKIRREEKKAREKEEREHTIKLYNTLLNSLSHELRTPISAIIGAVDHLKEQGDKIDPAIRMILLTEIDKAGIRLHRQVENLLSMSRLESGMLKPSSDWCDMNDLIHTLIPKLENDDKHIIQFEAQEDCPLFKLDAGLVEQVLYNILHNAIQYTQPDTSIQIELSAQTNLCHITISDNGEGFPPEFIDKSFEKFYRLPNTKTGGSGLGLSIAKGFTEAMGGSIQLENISSGGARFTLRIPAETSYLSNLKNE
ncbi:MAG: DUF4118 domain-containing protein [Chitinophagales bacterium]|nr:DUF4118 domain-containing protein [Chitinophagales bacterium]